MPIPVMCEHCFTQFQAPDRAVGRRVKCPECNGIVEVSDSGLQARQKSANSTRATPDAKDFTGSKIDRSQAGSKEPKRDRKGPSALDETAPRSRRPILVGASIGVVVLICAGVGAVLLFKSTSRTEINQAHLSAIDAADSVADAARDEAVPAQPAKPDPGEKPNAEVQIAKGADVAGVEKEVVAPPAGEIEALEDFDPTKALNDDRLKQLQSSNAAIAYSFADRGPHFRGEATSYSAAGPADYAVARAVVKRSHDEVTTHDIEGRMIVSAGGSIGSLRTVEDGEFRTVTFRRERPLHVGVLAASSAGRANVEAMAELQRNRAVRSVHEQNRAEVGEAATQRRLNAASEEEQQIRSRLAGVPTESGGQFGTREGTWMLYSDDNQIRVVGQYHAGERHGRFVCFDKQGHPDWEGLYVNNQLKNSHSTAANRLGTFGECAALYGHRAPISAVAFSADGRRIATSCRTMQHELAGAGELSEVRIWDVASWRLLATFPCEGVDPLMLFSPIGDTVAIAPRKRLYQNDKAVLWDVETGKKLADIRRFMRTITEVPEHDAKLGMSAVFSDDGRYFAALSAEDHTASNNSVFPINAAIIYDARSGAVLGSIPGVEQTAATNSGTAVVEFVNLEFSPENSYLCIRDARWRVGIWDIAGKELKAVLGDSQAPPPRDAIENNAELAAYARQFETIKSHLTPRRDPPMIGHSISNDGKTLLIWSSKLIELHSLESGQLIFQSSQPVASVAAYPDSGVWLCRQPDKSVEIRSLATGDALAALPVNSNAHTFGFTRKGRLMVSGQSHSTDPVGAGPITVRAQVETVDLLLNQTRLLSGPDLVQFDRGPFALSPDGRFVALGSADGCVRVWDLIASAPVQSSIENHSPTIKIESAPKSASAGEMVAVKCLAQDADADSVAFEFRTADDADWRFDRDGTCLDLFTHPGTVKFEVRAVDSRGAVSETLIHNVEVVSNPWREWGEAFRYTPEKQPLRAMVVMADGRKAVNDSVQESPYQNVFFTPDSAKLMAFGGNFRMLALSGKQHAELINLPSNQGSCASLSPDGQTLCFGLLNTLGTFRISTKKLQKTQQTAPSSVSCVAYSPDGKIIATGGAKAVCLWRAGDGKQIATINAENEVLRVAFSADSSRVAYLSTHSANILAVEDQQPVKSFKEERGYLTRLAFSRDGNSLIVLNHLEPWIHFWNVADGSARVIEYGTDDKGTAFDVNSTGETLAVARSDGTIVLFAVADGKVLTTLRGHEGTVFDMTFSSDGTQLASTGADGTVRVWKQLPAPSDLQEKKEPN